MPAKPPRSQSRLLSVGAALFRLSAEGPRFLLLRVFGYWDFPKGLLEPGEDPIAGARREIREETGIAELSFPCGEIFLETEVYAKGKIARYYLAETGSSEVRLGINPALGTAEHHEFRWLDVENARKLLAPRVQRILDWAQGQISSLHPKPSPD